MLAPVYLIYYDKENRHKKMVHQVNLSLVSQLCTTPFHPVTYRSQMAGRDRESDSERSRTLDVRAPIIAHAMDDEHQHEGDERFDQDTLPGGQSRGDAGHAEPADHFRRCGGLCFEKQKNGKKRVKMDHLI